MNKLCPCLQFLTHIFSSFLAILIAFPSQFWQPAGPTSEDIKPHFNGEKFSSLTNGSSINANNNHANNNNNGNVWEGRSIASSKLRLAVFDAFMDLGPGSDKHIFVEIDGLSHSYTDPLLEDIDLRQISDKFPSNKTGLKELYDKGPQNAFFLVKFWVCF